MSFAASSASADAPFGQIRVRAKPDSEEVSEAQILKTVLYYVVLLLIMPLVCFGVSKVFVLSFVLGWDINATRTNVVSAVIAIIALHVALVAYIIRAYFSEEPKKKIEKHD